MRSRRHLHRFLRPWRRSPHWLAGVGLLLLIAAAGAIYVSVVAWWQSRDDPFLTWIDLVPVRLSEVFAAAWLAFIGASIGSFLNVVAWRMPRGKSVRGRSFCPRCHTQLRARDNIPVFGWLLLGGRCRTCRLPISPRYPIVEAAVGFTVMVVGMAELYRLALPFQDQPLFWSPLTIPPVDASLVLIGCYHIVAVSVAWAQGLIRYDGHRLPPRLLGFASGVTVLPMLVYPALMVVPWQVSVESAWRPDWLFLDAVVRVVTGLAAAVFFSRGLARSFCPTADPKLDPLGGGTERLIDLVAIVGIPAVVIGWQSLPAVLVVASLFARVLGSKKLLGRTRLADPSQGGSRDAFARFAVALPLAMSLQISGWRWSQNWPLWPSVNSSPWVILAAAALALMIPRWLRDDERIRST